MRQSILRVMRIISAKLPSDLAIGRRIYTVRGEQVMIDRDLSELYGVENRALRQAVRRNGDKFPEDFLFKLTETESNNLIARGVSQSVIPPGYNTGGMQMFAFTEQGVAMLSTVLRSPNATSVSVAIMRAFVAMRRFLIIDSQVYLLGASVKDMGKGLCAIAPVGFSPEMVLGMVKG